MRAEFQRSEETFRIQGELAEFFQRVATERLTGILRLSFNKGGLCDHFTWTKVKTSKNRSIEKPVDIS